jgi:hypothetical protein
VLENGQLSAFFDEIWYTARDRHAEFKNHKTEVSGKKLQKLNVKKQYRFKKATLYEREVT